MAQLEKIKNSYKIWNIEPTKELLRYAEACDSYTKEKISSNQLQSELCLYLDQCASRSRALSAALDRIKEPPLGDIFTEATNMLVSSIVKSPDFLEKNLTVVSEKNVKLSDGVFRKPDVAIWENEKLVSIVECKTCLGRVRKVWLSEYEHRVSEFEGFGLQKDKLILFVETEHGWKGFPKTDTRVNDVWFALCPVGTWHGGGKTGEVPLSKKQNVGVVESLHKKLYSAIFEK